MKEKKLYPKAISYFEGLIFSYKSNTYFNILYTFMENI